MNRMVWKVISFVAVAFMSIHLFARELPLFDGRKVIGVEVAQWGDLKWRVHLRMIDKKGGISEQQVFPTDEYTFSRPAYEYYLNNMADIPVLNKTKLKGFGEVLKQTCIKRKQDAIERREKKAKEAKYELAKASTIFSRLNALFGYEIGAVFEVNKSSVLEESAPSPLRVIGFTPDKPFLTFDKYSLNITPISHRIFSITASAPYSKQTLELAKDALEKKFLDTLKYDDVRNEYYILGLSNKGNTRYLSLRKEGDRLRLALDDKKGFEMSKKEYEQQKDKVSSEAVNAL